MPEPAKHSRLTTLATVLTVVAALYLAQEVLIPVALAALLSFSLAPLHVRLQAWFGRIAGVIIVVTLACGVLGGVAYLVAGQLTELARMVPQYRENITEKLKALHVGVFEEATEAVKEIEKDVQAQRAVEKEKEKAEDAQELGAAPPTAPTTAPQPSLPVAPVPPRVAAARRDGVTVPPEPDPVKVQVVEPPPTSLQMVAGAFGPVLGPLGTAGIVIVLVVFMLLARQDLRDRIVRLMGRGRIGLTTQALDEAGQRVSRYLLMQAVVNALTGIAVALALMLVGVPGFFLWGLLSALLRFVPYVGPWIAAAMPVLVALAVFDGWTTPLIVIGCFVVIELISNNVLEPWLYGTSAGVSPLAVIVAAIFWTWLWGPVGLLLATPLTVCLVVLGKYVPHLAFVHVLFGDEPVLEPHARFYQRLAAHNQDEAGEVVETYFAECGSLADTFDRVVLPALSLVQADRQLAAVDGVRSDRAVAVLREIVLDVAELAEAAPGPVKAAAAAAAAVAAAPGIENHGAAPTPTPVASVPAGAPLPELPADVKVLVLPAHDDVDELAGLMLAVLVRSCGGTAEIVAVGERISGLVDVVSSRSADLVVVSALPPSATAHARHVHKRLRARFPELAGVVGLWNQETRLTEARVRLGTDERNQIVGTLRQAVVELDRLARTRPRVLTADAGAAAPRSS